MRSYLIIFAFVAAWSAVSYPYIEASPAPIKEDIENVDRDQTMNDGNEDEANEIPRPMVCAGSNGIKEIKWCDGRTWTQPVETDVLSSENGDTSNEMTFQKFHVLPKVSKCICF